MATNWLFWLALGSGLFGLLVILYCAVAKHNLRGKRFDKQTRLLIMLMGCLIIVESIDMGLTDYGWRFPYHSVVEGILAFFTVVLLGIIVVIVLERRNYARGIAAQNAQDSLEATEEL